MADATGPLFSLRDTLLSLHARLGHAAGQANAAARLLVRIGDLTGSGDVEASPVLIGRIRESTELLARVDVGDLDRVQALLDRLDGLLSEF